MITVDGSEGGGGLLRTALSLSTATGTPVTVEEVRGGRPNPGLRPSHLATVRTLATLADATVEGDREGAGRVVFEPGPNRLRSRTVEANIETAGSLTLLFDAVLPLSLARGLDGPLAVRCTGGTDVRWSPPLDFLRRVKLPLLRSRGIFAAVDADRRGFYPVGGGRATFHVAPSPDPDLSVPDRGDREGARVYVTATTGLADAEVAERGAARVTDRLSAAGIEVTERVVEYAAADSPGAIVVVALDYARSRAGFDALGERGTPVEDVADDAVDRALAFDDDPVPAVDRHLADQLVPLLAFSGGRVRVSTVTDHVRTAVEVTNAFRGPVRSVRVETEKPEKKGAFVVAG